MCTMPLLGGSLQHQQRLFARGAAGRRAPLHCRAAAQEPGEQDPEAKYRCAGAASTALPWLSTVLLSLPPSARCGGTGLAVPNPQQRHPANPPPAPPRPARPQEVRPLVWQALLFERPGGLCAAGAGPLRGGPRARPAGGAGGAQRAAGRCAGLEQQAASGCIRLWAAAGVGCVYVCETGAFIEKARGLFNEGCRRCSTSGSQVRVGAAADGCVHGWAGGCGRPERAAAGERRGCD